MIERGERVLPIEVKATPRPGLHDAAGLKAFLGEHPDAASAGLLLHGGSESFWLTKGVFAIPWWRVL